MSFFKVEHVTKRYAAHLALDDVSLEVPPQTIYGLLGPNGAGKTTLIRIINRITAPDSGSVFFDGHELNAYDVAQIGYLPEERGLYKKMKVGEQVLYLAQLKGLTKQEAVIRAKTWFDKFGIQNWWNKRVEELSKGMAQKIQFVTTVLHRPKLLIFDEPFSGFDPVNTELLKKEILELRNQGTTIIFSTHNMESVEELCENISLINHAKVILQGNILSIRRQYRQKTYKLTISGLLTEQEQKQISPISSIVENGITHLRLSVENRNINEILQIVMPRHELIAFEEELPSMNEIFIKTVKQQP